MVNRFVACQNPRSHLWIHIDRGTPSVSPWLSSNDIHTENITIISYISLHTIVFPTILISTKSLIPMISCHHCIMRPFKSNMIILKITESPWYSHDITDIVDHIGEIQQLSQANPSDALVGCSLCRSLAEFRSSVHEKPACEQQGYIHIWATLDVECIYLYIYISIYISIYIYIYDYICIYI